MAKILFQGVILAVALFIFNACAGTPEPVQKRVEKIDESELKLVLIKNDRIRFYDFGHLVVRDDSLDSGAPDSAALSAQDSIDSNANTADSNTPDLNSQDSKIQSPLAPNEIATLGLFRFGSSIGKFVLKDNEVCFINDCAPKWPASKAFFGKVSYDDLFEDILLQKDIFDGEGRQLQKDGGIIQHFTYNGEEIYYERKKGIVFFKNLTTGMTISIEDYLK